MFRLDYTIEASTNERRRLTQIREGSQTVYDKRALIGLVRDKALKFGDFTLASGKKASYYLDGKQVTLDSLGAKLIAEGILELLGPQLPKAVGGMAIGADPITAAVVTLAGVRGLSLKGILVRKEAKGHGTERSIEGPVRPGDDVVIVEDVVTTGGSSLEAIERVEAFGLKVKGVIAIIDRLEGGAQAFAARGYKFSSLLSIRDFGIEPPQ
jgi:orotate phosphoribosyltransferase